MVAGPSLPRRFEVIRELAAGGTGVVLEAIDRDGATRVAFKILHPPPPGAAPERDLAERVREEFAVAAGVRHPNLVRLGELHDLDGRWGFSMELVDGPTIFDWCRRGGDEGADGLHGWGTIDSLRPRFLEGRLRTAVGQIAGALAALHGAGIVHRDLRPCNLRIDRGERVDRVVVLDLGLAALAATRDDGAGRAGIVEYLAPEQVARGRVTTASDLYALGAILFEIITGRPPFIGTPADVANDKREHPAPRATQLVPELARDLDELCARLLDRDPARRPSAADVAAQFGTTDQPRVTGTMAAVADPRRERALEGRDGELALLRAAIEEAGAARPIVYVVHGPVGVGKTALLERLAHEAAAEGALVCAGRCGSRTATRYAAWDSFIDGISRHLAALDPQVRAAVLPEDAAAIAHLFPSFARVVPARSSSATAAELGNRARAALRALLARLTAEHRLVAILDDAHAADDESLDLLCELLQPPAPAVVTLFGVRMTPASAAAERARMQRLAALPIDLRFLPLGPLAPTAAAAFAERLLGSPAGAASLAEASSGNPLVLEQLAHAPDLAHDQTVVGLVAARLAAMPGSAQAIVRVLAAAEAPLRHDVIGSALGLTHRAVVRDLGLLAAARLVHTTGSRRNDLAELHHGVVADAVRTGPPLATEHALLAAALDLSGIGDERTRLRHWLAAGDREHAGALAVAMVAHARDALAFAAALVACDDALALPQAPGPRAALLRARADALLGAGDAARAADAYLDAAAAADAAAAGDALDARRIAAELLLRTGELARGFDLAHAVAASAGLDLAISNSRMIGRLLIERARSRLRGTTLADEADATAAHIADVCTSLAAALAHVDPLRAAWFSTRAVRAALDSGDPRRAARAFAHESGVQVARGGPGRPRARRALALADALVPMESLAPDRDRADRALIEAARADAACMIGDFPEALARADRAAALYRDCSPRFAFEARAAAITAITALAWLGRWGEAAARRRALAAVAAATGDRHALVHATTGDAVVADLATTDALTVRRAIADAMRGWNRDRAPGLFAREVIALATCDLAAGAPGAAADRLAAAWPLLEDAHVLHAEPLRAALLSLSARAALLTRNVQRATAATRLLARIGWAAGPAHLLEAALAHLSGDLPATLTLLAHAETASHAAHLSANAAAALHLRGTLTPGPTGATLVATAATAATTLSLGAPSFAFPLLAPLP